MLKCQRGSETFTQTQCWSCRSDRALVSRSRLQGPTLAMKYWHGTNCVSQAASISLSALSFASFLSGKESKTKYEKCIWCKEWFIIWKRKTIYLARFLLPLGLLVQAPLGHLEVLNLLPVLKKINVRNSSDTTLTGRKRLKKKNNNWQAKYHKICNFFSNIRNQNRKSHIQ